MPRGSTYANNAQNRSLGRVGAPMGSAPVSRSSSGSGGSSYSSCSQSTYVNNSYNRSVGRVGAPMGSMPVSRSSGASSGSSHGSYVDNAYNRSVGRVGAPMGSMPVSRSSGASSGSSQGTYVDNAYNQSVGRVGAPMGSMPVSRSSGASSGSSQGTYVDNAYNRSVGRVGAPMGSMPVSRSSGASSGSSRSSYVDNAYNRSVGRVGAPMGSMPVSRSSSASSGSSHDTYVDNAYNRSVGRVGAALGSMSISKKSQGSESASYSSAKITPKYYVDNPLNRRLGRVGKPLGTAPYHRPKPTEDHYYKDNATNRELERVGKKIPKRGSRQNKRKSGQPADFMKDLHYELGCDDEPGDYDFGPEVTDQEKENMIETVFNNIRRRQVEEQWQETNLGKHAQTDVKLFKYDGPIIPFAEINLGKKIGQGGFGDVHFAKWAGSVIGFGNLYFPTWGGSVVAVKKLRVQRVSQRRLRQFQDEVKVLCHLDHPHIVKFMGACIVTPNLAIVMEYMQKSLYEALHVEEVDYSDAEQYQIITGMADGLDYLHQKSVAHCDIKSTNILLDIPQDGVVAKISDFGLSMMKNETETSQSVAKVVQGVGTPKYSAPEVLDGVELDQAAMCKADIYSMSVVAWEVICQEEPFSGLNIHQLQRRVMGGEGEVELKIPNDINISGELLSLLKECWSRNANKRPSAGDFKKRVARCGGIQKE